MTYLIGFIIGIGLLIIIDRFLLPIFKSKTGLSQDSIKLKMENETLQKENEKMRALNNEQQEELIKLREQKVRLETEKDMFQKNLESVKQVMKLEFQETAKNLFKENTENAKKDLTGLINPLKQDIRNFRVRIDEVHGENKKERSFLEKELSRIYKVTEELNHILKGGGKGQGGFGEVVLENILEHSGLHKGREFIMQGEGLGLKSEEGDSLKPDVTVLLPEEKRIFIDSKVSLTDYYKYKNSKTDEERQKHIKNIVASIYRHIKDLSGKYSSLKKSPDFTIMFFPEEGAFTLALQSDDQLYQKAWKERIVITGPTTLYATLKTVHFIWKTERQNRNAAEIATESGRLYDKFVGFVTDMNQIDVSLEKAKSSYLSALNKLREGRGNLVGRVERIKRLGAQTEKALPENFHSSN